MWSQCPRGYVRTPLLLSNTLWTFQQGISLLSWLMGSHGASTYLCFISYFHWKKLEEGMLNVNIWHLHWAHMCSLFLCFFNILEIFLIKIFKFSFPFLLKHPGECWQHFLFISTLYHQIPDQCCPIECLKCDWCNWTTKSLIEVIVTNLNLGLNSHMWLPYWALQSWKKRLPKPGYFNTIRDRAVYSILCAIP